jgi:hypothetical protein
MNLPKNNICPKCKMEIPNNKKECPKCDDLSKGCAFFMYIFLFLCMASVPGTLAVFIVGAFIPTPKEIGMFADVVTGDFYLRCVLISYAVCFLGLVFLWLKKTTFFEFANKNVSKGFIFMGVLILIVFSCVYISHDLVIRNMLGKTGYQAWNDLIKYEKVNDLKILDNQMQKNDEYREIVSKYLFLTHREKYLIQYNAVSALCDSLIKNYTGYAENYKLEDTFRLIEYDYEKSYAMFQGLNWKEMTRASDYIRSVVRIKYESNVVGHYDRTGEAGIQTIANVYVIDVRKKTIIANYDVFGGMPSETVSSANIFSSPLGSQPSSKKIKNEYDMLPLK